MSMTLREQTGEVMQRPRPVSAAPEQGAVRLSTRDTVRECLRIQATACRRTRLGRLLGRSPLHPDARDRYEEALAQLVVREELKNLGPEWTVLSDVPIGAHAADIDHVVIGPGGIFTLTVRNAGDAAIWVGGRTAVADDQPVDFVRRAQTEAARAARSLSNAAGGPVQITPLLVLNRPARLTLRGPAVGVVTVRRLAGWLQRRRRLFTPEAVAYYAMVAREPATWNVEPGAAGEFQRDLQRFDRLRREVEAAADRRRALRIASGVALLATITEGLSAAVQTGARRPAAALTSR